MSEVMGKLGSVMNFCHAPNFFFEKQTHTHTRERKNGFNTKAHQLHLKVMPLTLLI